MDSSSSAPENILSSLQSKTSIAFLALLVLILVITLFTILFPTPLSEEEERKRKEGKSVDVNEKAAKEITKDVFILIAFIVVAFGLIFLVVPDFKSNVPKLIKQLSGSLSVFVYTIFFLLFFLSVKKSTLDDYSFMVVPLTMIISIFMFYRAFTSSKELDKNSTLSILYTLQKKNLNYERINAIILFLCLLTISIVYYTVDPGGMISKYFGSSLLLAILFGAFSLVFLIVTLTMPTKTETSTNLLSQFSNVSLYGTLAFVLFLLIAIIGIYKFPGGITSNKTAMAEVIILMLVIGIVCGTGLVINVFPNAESLKSEKSPLQNAMLVVFSVLTSGMFIAWLTYGIQHLSGRSGITSFILNLLLVLSFLMLIYKTIFVKIPNETSNMKKTAFFSLIKNLILYIPCLFADNFFKYTGQEDTVNSILLLISTIVLLALYLKYPPDLIGKFASQGGKLLINHPINIDSYRAIGSYHVLNGIQEDAEGEKDSFDYQYAISFWVFLTPSNSATDAKQFVNILDYGNKPTISYQSSTNTLRITMDQRDLRTQLKGNKLVDFDKDGNRIIYETKDFPLQKWNNIVVNYSAGTLDIFLNNELVKSASGVVPYMTYDTLSVGAEKGLKGGICNLVYFDKPLTTTNMYYLYNLVSHSNPPISSMSTETVLV